MAKLKITRKCLNSFVQGCSIKSVDEILCMVMPFTETWPGLVQEVRFCNLGKFWQWSPISSPALPQKFTQTDTPVSLLAGYHKTYTCRCGLFYSRLQMAITLGKASNMVLIATKTPLTRNVFDMSLVVGSRELFPEVPEVTPI